MDTEELFKEHNLLLKRIKKRLHELEELYKKYSGHWTYEDPIYRFYHQSFKVFHLQDETREIVETLQSLMPHRENNKYFLDIYKEGTKREFKSGTNANWLKETRPVLEAFFHARFFLEMAVKYGKGLETAPNALPSGWAALLYFYKLR